MDDLIHAYSLISKGISMDTPEVEENVDISTETNSSKLEHVGSNSAQFPIVEHGQNFAYSTSLELRVGAEIAMDAIIQSRFLIVIYNHNRRLFRFDTYIHSNGTGNRNLNHVRQQSILYFWTHARIKWGKNNRYNPQLWNFGRMWVKH
ncbi:hypothetical protein CRE_14491 [Caenorhabditis remanei]|uniref:Uncharacterized protein n=1 Tax=Caenorhabditis remanei TaxID=31234 RepID=E3M971_CAERE|nr:hypothetical protein CRE_14491 [Caenorhabditis remanei]